jgi:hypothetical protein
MANRYGFFRVRPGDGSGNPVSGAIHPEIQELGVAYNSVIPVDPATQQNRTYCFCVFPDVKLSQILQLPNAYVFPDSSLDHLVDLIGNGEPDNPNDALGAFKQSIGAYTGIDNSVVQTGRTYRDVVYDIYLQCGGLFAKLDYFSIN